MTTPDHTPTPADAAQAMQLAFALLKAYGPPATPVDDEALTALMPPGGGGREEVAMLLWGLLSAGSTVLALLGTAVGLPYESVVDSAIEAAVTFERHVG